MDVADPPAGGLRHPPPPLQHPVQVAEVRLPRDGPDDGLSRPVGGRLCGDAIVALPDGSKFAKATADTPDDDWQGLADDLVRQLRRQDADAIIDASRR